MGPDFWDERYRSSTALWSGQPNPQLVAEAAGLAPGRALAAGCGEGADAIWLAERGWAVTAVDISTVALARAATRAAEVSAGVAQHITWLHAVSTTGRPKAATTWSRRSSCSSPWTTRLAVPQSRGLSGTRRPPAHRRPPSLGSPQPLVSAFRGVVRAGARAHLKFPSSQDAIERGPRNCSKSSWRTLPPCAAWFPAMFWRASKKFSCGELVGVASIRPLASDCAPRRSGQDRRDLLIPVGCRPSVYGVPWRPRTPAAPITRGARCARRSWVPG